MLFNITMMRKRKLFAALLMIMLVGNPTVTKASVCEMVKDTVPIVTEAIGEDWEQVGTENLVLLFDYKQ